jgi:muconolactone D-isomerase
MTSTKEKPMEFLVEFEVNVPDGALASEVDPRYSAEATAAARLVDEGHLVRLWKPPAEPGETKALGLYRADSEQQLAGLLAALPLYDWMHITVTPLKPHPNDPVSEATVSPAARSRQ